MLRLFKKSKGLDKPVFIVASIALAIMIVVLYFTSVSGVVDSGVGEILSFASDNSPDSAGITG